MMTDEDIFRTLTYIYDENIRELFKYYPAEEWSEEFSEYFCDTNPSINSAESCDIFIKKINEIKKLLYNAEYQEYLTENGFNFYD